MLKTSKTAIKYLLLSLLLLPAAVLAGEAGQFVRVINKVTVDGAPAAKNDPFQDTSTIKTAAKSLAALRFTDDSKMLLRANSELKVTDYAFDSAAPGKGRFVTEFVAGGMRVVTGVIGKKNTPAVRFNTPMATIGIRGTEFMAAILNGRLFLEVLQGCIIVNPSVDNREDMCHGQTLVVSREGRVDARGEEASRIIEAQQVFDGLRPTPPTRVQDVNSVYQWGPWQQLEQDELLTANQAGSVDVQPAGSPLGQSESDLAQQDMTGINAQAVVAQNAVVVPEGPSISIGDGDFQDIGGSGVIRGQAIWTTNADIDLHMTAPGGEGHVAYYNQVLSLNDGGATAELDHDNLGGTIDVQPNLRVENITVTGNDIPNGDYLFWVYGFSGATNDAPTNVSLTLTGDDGDTSVSHNPVIQDGDVSDTYIVNHNDGAATYSVSAPPADPNP